MAWRIPKEGTDRYALVSFDKKGKERKDDIGASPGLFSEKILAELRSNPRSDVFLFSHGWKGDVPAAKDQYDRWIGALQSCVSDRQRAQAKYPNFTALHIGIHWPSLPFGDEEITVEASFSATGSNGVEKLVEQYSERLDDAPEVRPLLEIIVKEASRNAAADALTDVARNAYMELDRVLALGADGAAGEPGSDRAVFDPDAAAAYAAEATEYGGFDLGGIILSPLRQLSFWSMKKRARIVGESGVHDFLKSLQRAAPTSRFHLMGHSFGCIVMSSALGGVRAESPLDRPVDSCVLVQGAMSLWSYAAKIPEADGAPGYFHRLLTGRKISGPILVTTSKHDRAVGTLYPIAAGLARQVDLAPADLPKYGAIGAFGIRGINDAELISMLPTNQDYNLRAGRIYNLESSRFIAKGDGISGAHSDIDGPEVAHAIWQAAII